MSSLDAVLWPELGWNTINLSELITPQQVKIKYMRAVAKVHPDKVYFKLHAFYYFHYVHSLNLIQNFSSFFLSLFKLKQDTTIEQRLIANSVFSALNKAWDAFKQSNNM